MKIVKKILLIIAVLFLLSLNFCGYHMERDCDRQKAEEENSTESMAVEDATVSPHPSSSAQPAEKPVDQDASPDDAPQESGAVSAPTATPEKGPAAPSFEESAGMPASESMYESNAPIAPVQTENEGDEI